MQCKLGYIEIDAVRMWQWHTVKYIEAIYVVRVFDLNPYDGYDDVCMDDHNNNFKILSTVCCV